MGLHLRTREPAERTRGFSLIELMVVVAVIAVVVAMAIPGLIQARVAANESSAVGCLKTIATANEQYRTRFRVYADSLVNMATAGYLDDHMGSGAKGGYTFSYWGDVEVWDLVAVPTTPGASGNRRFWIDHTGVIRFTHTGIPSSTDHPID